MRLTIIDWLIIGRTSRSTSGSGFTTKPRGKSTTEFFLSGRKSLVARGHIDGRDDVRRDTPLAVTGFVAKNGIAGNWIWWCFLASGMLTVFFYARCAPSTGDDGRRVCRDPLCGKARRILARLSCPVSRDSDQLHHPRMGEPGDGEDPAVDLRHRQFEALVIVLG